MIGEDPKFKGVNEGESSINDSKMAFVYEHLSRSISRKLITYMKNHNMSKHNLGVQLQLSNEEVEEWLSGKYNFTLKDVVKINQKFGIKNIIDV